MGNLGQEFWRTIAIFRIITLEFTEPQILFKTNKALKLRLKMTIYGILKLLFEKTVVSLDTITLELFKLESFVWKQKFLNLGPKLS